MTSQKKLTQAALHAFYYFISGNSVVKKLKLSDFTFNPSIENETDRFRDHLKNVAKLSNNTITSQCCTLRLFLYSTFNEKEFSPKDLNMNHVRLYLTNTIQHVSNASKKTMITRIRNYLRFLNFEDSTDFDIALNFPMTPPVWKQATLPKHLTSSEIATLLSSYNQSDSIGIRNYAIAHCLSDLGVLRSG